VKFDVIATNPPFQDRTTRKRTPHKLWIEFTRAAFSRWLSADGLLLQISPASFQSPSSKVLKLMCEHDTQIINFDVSQHFPGVGSSFAYYAVYNQPTAKDTTIIIQNGRRFETRIDEDLLWLPTDFCEAAVSIHRKVMWDKDVDRLRVEHDYVTCHNIRRGETLSREQTADHVFPVFHTNAQTWYSSVQQDWSLKPKVMWTRSGYTKPFVDAGTLGGTDMAYFVLTTTREAAQHLQHNLTLPLITYILRTARWSGFGNDIVFEHLPSLPTDQRLTHEEICALFGLTEQEREYVESRVGRGSPKG